MHRAPQSLRSPSVHRRCTERLRIGDHRRYTERLQTTVDAPSASESQTTVGAPSASKQTTVGAPSASEWTTEPGRGFAILARTKRMVMRARVTGTRQAARGRASAIGCLARSRELLGQNETYDARSTPGVPRGSLGLVQGMEPCGPQSVHRLKIPAYVGAHASPHFDTVSPRTPTSCRCAGGDQSETDDGYLSAAAVGVLYLIFERRRYTALCAFRRRAELHLRGQTEAARNDMAPTLRETPGQEEGRGRCRITPGGGR